MLTNVKTSKKLTYSIGQVASHFNLPQSVLRYWETVFPMFSPAKSAGGSRQYSNVDVDIIERIKDLLYEKGFTIKGAILQMEKDDASTAPEILSQPMDLGTERTDEIPEFHGSKALIEKLKELIRILDD